MSVAQYADQGIPARVVVQTYDGREIKSPWLTPEAAQEQLDQIRVAMKGLEEVGGLGSDSPIELPWLLIQAAHIQSVYLEQQEAPLTPEVAANPDG